jgi:hypothetical protein
MSLCPKTKSQGKGLYNMNNDQAVSVLNDVAYTYSSEQDTDENREELISELEKVIEMNDHFTSQKCESAIRTLRTGGSYSAEVKTLLDWSEEMLDEIMENY